MYLIVIVIPYNCIIPHNFQINITLDKNLLHTKKILNVGCKTINKMDIIPLNLFNKPHELGTSITSISQIRKLRPREVT